MRTEITHAKVIGFILRQESTGIQRHKVVFNASVVGGIFQSFGCSMKDLKADLTADD